MENYSYGEIIINLDCILVFKFLHPLNIFFFTMRSDTIIITKKQNPSQLFYNIMTNTIVFMQTKIYILFWVKKLRKRQNLGIILKNLRKTFIVPDYMVYFDPLVFLFLVTGWRTCVEFGFYQSSTLFEGNKSGREV